MNDPGDVFGVFALSSAISAHVLSRLHFAVEKSWYENKWFWGGLFGNLPALVAMIAHIFISKSDGEKKGSSQT